MTLPQLTKRSEDGNPLTFSEIQSACDLLLDEGQSTEARADFLQALHRRGESAGEIAGFVEVLLERAVKLPFSGAGCIDVCGTGGDRAGFFNISTASMFVVAGAGAQVIKHGNRGITSKSGGADVLEALGVRIDLPPKPYLRPWKWPVAASFSPQPAIPRFAPSCQSGNFSPNAAVPAFSTSSAPFSTPPNQSSNSQESSILISSKPTPEFFKNSSAHAPGPRMERDRTPFKSTKSPPRQNSGLCPRKRLYQRI